MGLKIEKNAVDTFSSLDLFAKQVVEGFITGLHKSPFHGFSVEFAEHRLYNKGESVKNIDWKVFGRTDKLFVKKFEEETNLRCQIVIDNSSSMFFPEQKTLNLQTPNKMYFAVHAAAVLLHVLKKQRDAFGLTLFSDNIELHTQAKSTGIHHNYILNELEKLLKYPDYNNNKKTALTHVLHNVADAVHKRSLIIIFSDMLDSFDNFNDVLQALQHLKHNKHEVILFHVFDKKKEIDFNFENKPYKFIDIENLEEIKLNPKEVKARFIKARTEFKKELYLKCAAYKIELIETDINQGFEQVIFPFFVKRQKLH
ncbi:MAG: DUF58 domain-containing protein [Bacteroidales bacterium]|nr:DUF58 domain-containing protein [Bacteroidales bacterium]